MNADRNETLRKICLADYLLHLAGLIFSAGLFTVVAVIINYIKRDDARGTIYESHMTWMIRTFWWWALGWVITGAIAIVTLGFGAPLMLIPAIWFLYRMIKGLLRLNEGRAMDEAQATPMVIEAPR